MPIFVRWGLTILIGALMIALIIRALPAAQQVENGILARVTAYLETTPTFTRVSLSPAGAAHQGVQGRVVYLTGRVDDAAALAALVDEMANLGGVRRVDVSAIDLVPLIATPADYTFSASTADGDVAVRGLAGDFDTQQALIALVGEALNAREDQIIITLADPMPVGWVQSISAALAQLATLENGSIQITGEQAVLSGTASSVETFRVAEQFANVMAVEATMPGRLGTLDAMLDDYFLTAEKRGQTLTLTGGVPNASVEAEVLGFASHMLPGFTVESGLLISPNAPTTDWADSTKSTIAAVMSFREGTATFRAGSLTLNGVLADGPLQGQTIEEIQGRFAADVTFDTTQTVGVFYTNLDRERLDLFSSDEDDEQAQNPEQDAEQGPEEENPQATEQPTPTIPTELQN